MEVINEIVIISDYANSTENVCEIQLVVLKLITCVAFCKFSCTVLQVFNIKVKCKWNLGLGRGRAMGGILFLKGSCKT